MFQYSAKSPLVLASFNVPAVNFAGNVDWGDVIGNKNDTMDGTSVVSLIRTLGSAEHQPLFTGIIRYVDGTNGNNANSGLSPDAPKETIGGAIVVSLAGDAITIRAGTYDENGLVLALDGLELWGEIGARIVNTAGGATECLTVSGNSCRVRGFDFEQVGVIGIVITGDECVIEECRSDGCTVGYDVDDDRNNLINCQDLDCTVTGYDISASRNLLVRCTSIAAGGGSRGFYLSAVGSDENILLDCHSLGNGTAGFEIVLGANLNKIAFSTSGGSDGDTIDNGLNNDWPGYIDQLSTEHHEHIFPLSAGQGVAGDPINVANATTDGAGGNRQDQNYWGDITRIIPPDTLTTRWICIGIYIHAVATADIQQWEIFFTYENIVSAQNGGNDWDENETVLTVADGTLFQNGDVVWITGNDRVEGEILLVSGAPVGNVVTIARETTADVEAGLRYDYDATGVNNRVYLVRRVGTDIYSHIEGDYSAGSARDHARYIWHEGRQLGPNAALLMRMLNASDGGASSLDVRAIYED